MGILKTNKQRKQERKEKKERKKGRKEEEKSQQESFLKTRLVFVLKQFQRFLKTPTVVS